MAQTDTNDSGVMMAADGTPVFQRIHNTIHNLAPPGSVAERQ